MSVLSSFTPEQSFWQSAPLFRATEPFATLYKNDKSERKERSSSKMWLVACLTDLSPANPYRGLIASEREVLLSKSFFGEADYVKKNRKELQPLLDAYEKLDDSPSKRQLRAIEHKMEQRTRLLLDVDYAPDLTNAKELDDIIKATEPMLKVLATLKKIALEEEDKAAGRGGARQSFTEEFGG